MYRIDSNSIGSRLLLLFIALSTLAGVSAGIAWYSHQKTVDSIDQLLHQSIPDARNTEKIHHKNLELILSTDTLKLINDEVVLEKAYKKLIDDRNIILALFDNLPVQDASSKSNLRNNLQKINQHIDEQISLVKETIVVSNDIEKDKNFILNSILDLELQIKILLTDQRYILKANNAKQVKNAFFNQYLQAFETLTELSSSALALENIIRQLDQVHSNVFLSDIRNQFSMQIKNIVSSTNKLGLENRKILADKVNVITEKTLLSENIFSKLEDKISLQENFSNLQMLNTDIQYDIKKSLLDLSVLAEENAKSDYLTTKKIINISDYVLVFVAIISILAPIAFMAFYIKPYLISRLKKLADETKSITNGKLEIDIDTKGDDEISQLSQALENFRKALIDKKATEEQREVLIEQLMKINSDLENFAYVASHDMQEPLRMITNFTEMLGKRYYDKIDSEGKKYIDISVSSAKRMQMMIDDLLAYGRISDENLQYSDISVHAVIDYVKSNLIEAIDKTGAKIIIPETMPMISADFISVVQIFQNIISNAIKYQIKNNKPKIIINYHDKPEEWLFSIEDNGIGIAPENHKKIFIPFKRLHQQYEYSGTGIGLATCRKIVAKYGGEIWVESNINQGSTFYFTIFKSQIDFVNNKKSA